MENRIGSSNEAEIPKKSRSLDLKSLYQSEGSKEAQTKNLKRKVGIDVSVVEKKHERKKSRQAVSISGFRKVNGNGSKSLEEVYNGSLSSGSHDSKDSKSGLNQRLNHSSGFSSISETLEGSFTRIPRRKRGFVGRRKVENVSQVSKSAGLSSGEVGNVDQVGKLTGKDTGKQVKTLKVKQKKGSDEFKENGNGEKNSGKHFEEEAECPGHLAVNGGDLSIKKSHTGQFVENNGDSSSKKSLRKRNRKRKGLVPDGKSVAKDGRPSTSTTGKITDDLQDEDEENLEENAARMLSSRFDPSCTGFSLNSKVSSLPSTNGLSFLLSSGQEFTAHGSNYVSGSESASVDTAGRVLRPRKQHREKGSSRKRRHYYEIFTGDLDAYWVLNRRIKVFWPLDQSWYYGLISDYDTVKKLHHIKYDDRDEEWINLQDERFKLLLLPSEVPGKPQRKRSVAREKRSNGENGKLKPNKEKKRDLTTEDDNYMGNYMDSEPIISWLARSSQRVKSSPFRASKKQKISGLSLTSVLPSLTDDGVSRHESLDGGLRNKDISNLSGNSVLPDRFGAGGRIELSPSENPFHPKANKLPVVYYRRRFRNPCSVSRHSFEVNHVSTSLPESDTSHGHVGVASGPLKRLDISLERLDPDAALEKLDTVEALWLTDVTGFLKLNFQLLESRQFRFELSFPVLSICNYSFGKDHTWFFHSLLLLQYGTLVTMWPRVHLQMLFVDNMVGLRFLLFEGCLKQAIAFVFQVLAVFPQPTEHWKFADLQLPVTSIKFKFSCIQDFRKQLVFAFYNFAEVKISKWMDLDSRLKRHCLLTKQLPLSECTYDNIKALQNGTSQLLSSSVCNDSSRIKDQIRSSRQCISLVGVSRESTCVNACPSSSNFDKSHRWFPPFALSFTAAPTFFLGLHLKLLMEHSVTHISFQDHVSSSIECPENSGCLPANDCSIVEDCSNKGSESTPDNNCKASRDVDCNGFLSCSKTVPQEVDISVTSVGDWMKPSLKHHNGGVNVENSAISKDTGKLGTDTVASLQKWPFHHSESEQCHQSPKPLVDHDKSCTGSHSLMNGITVEIPSFNQFDKRADKELHRAQQSTDLSWNMNGGIIPSPNPTARRSTWHRNRSSSTSFGYLAHGWADGRADFLQNNFGNGPKKPRTQVSYAMPFGGFDYGSNNKGHSQKGLPHKRIRTANEKRSADVSRVSERNLEELSCEANVLITHGDRGWRECGVQVVLELFDHNEWKLAVKISGITKYSYKAHQFLQPGSTNRFTHAMMWKGGKDWILEFPDRSQWARFKEMHEECYNRNIRAASVRNIPIPGVRLIEENDDNGIEVPFVRSSSKYFRQIETDIEMALDPLRVLYDMDSDDEQWVLKNRTSSEAANSSSWEISDEMFEKTMDMFEKAAYSQQCNQFTSDEIEDLMAGLGPMKAIKIIHEYWQQKRQRKGMPLIRHLQPPLWERYQQQLREWELAKSTTLSNGCHEKVAHVEKPPMFAFCLKPRGLEVPNKGSKHRSQRKISVTGQSNFFSDHDGFHAYGRRLNGFASGDEKAVYQGHNYEPLDDSPLPQISPRVFSPRYASGNGYFSMNSDRYERNHVQKLYRSKSKKPGAFMFPNDTQMVASYNQRMFDKRNGFHQWNIGFSDWPSRRYYHIDGPLCHGPEHFDSSDVDEFRLRDASGAAQHALNMAKLKREKAQRLLYRADLAIHKAVVALMTAEAIKASSEDLNGDG